jgi:hypothetical protein
MFMLFCNTFSQETANQISSEALKFHRKYDENVTIFSVLLAFWLKYMLNLYTSNNKARIMH